MTPTIVVPFRAGGKTRLPGDIRVEIGLAMLGDVLEACIAVARTRLVTDDAAARIIAADLGVEVVDDPAAGQGAAVLAALSGLSRACLVVNADLPRLRPSDLGALALPAERGTMALVEARDGTTNALALPFPDAFAPLYGRRSAAQFRAHAEQLGLVCHGIGLANLEEDVDTMEDLVRIAPRAGSRTRELFALLSA